ncbi:MAG: ribulose-phosphate 3-epimerase [Elusimicrobiota bacterium]
MTSLSVSILNMDFGNLEKEIRSIERMSIDSFHMDIMDGHLVDNISFGPAVVEKVREITDIPIHSHLMISNPERFTKRFFEAGSDTVTIHAETLEGIDTENFFSERTGVSFNPDYPVEEVFPYLDKVGRVLVMSVMAGFGGQEFVESSLKSIEVLAEKRSKDGHNYIISVDGGVNEETSARCIDAGADELIVGSYITKSDDPESKISRLRTLFRP